MVHGLKSAAGDGKKLVDINFLSFCQQKRNRYRYDLWFVAAFRFEGLWELMLSIGCTSFMFADNFD